MKKTWTQTPSQVTLRNNFTSRIGHLEISTTGNLLTFSRFFFRYLNLYHLPDVLGSRLKDLPPAWTWAGKPNIDVTTLGYEVILTAKRQLGNMEFGLGMLEEYEEAQWMKSDWMIHFIIWKWFGICTYRILLSIKMVQHFSSFIIGCQLWWKVESQGTISWCKEAFKWINYQFSPFHL